MKIIVIGAGIGGLTTAIALHRLGIDAEVYEQAPVLREVGAGIALEDNALRALDLLGMGDAIRSQCIADRPGEVQTWAGKTLIRFPPIGVIHRAEMLATLGRQATAEKIHTGRQFTAFEQDSGGVRVRFENGSTARGDAMIAADGLRSAVRTQLFGKRRIRYAGYTAWRGVAEYPSERLEMTESWGPGRRFGVVPMKRDRVYWFATRNAPEGETDPRGQTKTALGRLFEGWHKPIEAVLEAMREEAILRNDIYDIDPLANLCKGRAALLGDAAHPMTPDLGQGACQAIEDAVVLAVCLKQQPSAEAGLLAYQRRRIGRIRDVVLRSRRLGKLAQMQNPAACWIRNALVGAMPAAVTRRQMQSVTGAEIVEEHEKALFRQTKQLSAAVGSATADPLPDK